MGGARLEVQEKKHSRSIQYFFPFLMSFEGSQMYSGHMGEYCKNCK